MDLEGLCLYFSPHKISDFKEDVHHKFKGIFQIEKKYGFNSNDVLEKASSRFLFRSYCI